MGFSLSRIIGGTATRLWVIGDVRKSPFTGTLLLEIWIASEWAFGLIRSSRVLTATAKLAFLSELTVRPHSLHLNRV